jgi:hypothetical protein
VVAMASQTAAAAPSEPRRSWRLRIHPARVRLERGGRRGTRVAAPHPISVGG